MTAGRNGTWEMAPLPDTTGPVVTIQADGHELTWLMDAIREGKNKATIQYYKETWGITDETI